MGRCILICRRRHLRNNPTLMNPFPFGRGGGVCLPRYLGYLQRMTGAGRRSPRPGRPVPLRLSGCLIRLRRHLSPPALALFPPRGSYSSVWRAGRGSKYGGAGSGPWVTPHPCVCAASPRPPLPRPPLPRPPLPRPLCVPLSPVIHRPARSPASSY